MREINIDCGEAILDKKTPVITFEKCKNIKLERDIIEKLALELKGNFDEKKATVLWDALNFKVHSFLTMKAKIEEGIRGYIYDYKQDAYIIMVETLEKYNPGSVYDFYYLFFRRLTDHFKTKRITTLKETGLVEILCGASAFYHIKPELVDYLVKKVGERGSIVVLARSGCIGKKLSIEETGALIGAGKTTVKEEWSSCKSILAADQKFYNFLKGGF